MTCGFSSRCIAKFLGVLWLLSCGDENSKEITYLHFQMGFVIYMYKGMAYVGQPTPLRFQTIFIFISSFIVSC